MTVRCRSRLPNQRTGSIWVVYAWRLEFQRIRKIRRCVKQLHAGQPMSCSLRCYSLTPSVQQFRSSNQKNFSQESETSKPMIMVSSSSQALAAHPRRSRLLVPYFALDAASLFRYVKYPSVPRPFFTATRHRAAQ